MSNKEQFILEINNLIQEALECQDIPFEGLSENAELFFNELQTKSQSSKKEITENGKKILQFMQNNIEKYNNDFTAKNIGEGLFVSGRSISGSIRKLITDGYCIKNASEPTIKYSLTDKGKNFSILS